VIVEPALTTTLLLAAGMVLAPRPDLLGGGRRRHEGPREVVVLYPVRSRTEAAMRDDLSRIGSRDVWGRHRRVLAVTDHDDVETLAALRRLRAEFAHLDVLVAPDAADPSWSAAWGSWLADARSGREAVWRETRSGRRLSPRQRRQVVYGHHHLVQ
jgi:hypothetical protein